jgi:hypothetical protein
MLSRRLDLHSISIEEGNADYVILGNFDSDSNVTDVRH